MRVQTQIQHHGYPMVSRLASKDIQVLVLGRDPDSTPLCCGCLGFAQSFAASRCQPGQPGQPKPTKPRPWRFGVSPRATSQEPARIKPCYEKIRENTRKTSLEKFRDGKSRSGSRPIQNHPVTSVTVVSDVLTCSGTFWYRHVPSICLKSIDVFNMLIYFACPPRETEYNV